MLKTEPNHSWSHYCGDHIDYILLSPDLFTGTISSRISPINHHIISDHRALYCNIDVKTLFSVPPIEESIQSTRRKLQLSGPVVVTKYINKFDSLYIEHHIYDRLDVLVDRFANA